MSAFPTNTPDRTQLNPRLLSYGLLTTTDDRLYAVPAGKRTALTAVVFCNVTALAATFRMHHVLPGRTSTTTNAQYYDSRLNANVTVIDQTPRYLDSGDELRGRAGTASAVSFAVYGYEEVST